MIGDTLTMENLTAIKKAMDMIKSNDQSDYFKKYYKEVSDRILVVKKDLMRR